MRTILCLIKVQYVEMCYLEDGVHGDSQWAIPRILRDLKDVNAPSVYVLQLLPVNNIYHYNMLHKGEHIEEPVALN